MLQIIYKNYKESFIKFPNSKYGYLNEIFKKILTKKIYFLKLCHNVLKKNFNCIQKCLNYSKINLWRKPCATFLSTYIQYFNFIHKLKKKSKIQNTFKQYIFEGYGEIFKCYLFVFKNVYL